MIFGCTLGTQHTIKVEYTTVLACFRVLQLAPRFHIHGFDTRGEGGDCMVSNNILKKGEWLCLFLTQNSS